MTKGNRNIFFSADCHYFHRYVMLACKRPFETVEQMNNALIENWNAKVKRGDDVFLLGDVFVKCKVPEAQAIREKLNGNIYLIRGNHDSVAESLYKKMPRAWVVMKDVYYLNAGETGTDYENHFVLCHYPMRSWNGSHRGTANLFGHCHGNLKVDPTLRQMDVGVDVHNYEPISLDYVKEWLSTHTKPTKTLPLSEEEHEESFKTTH